MAAGHRERVYTRFLNGDEKISELDIMELLLFYCVPVKDVKPLATRLLKRLGSVNAVISANPGVLTSVEGVGKKTAAFFEVLRLLDKHVAEPVKPKITNVVETVRYFTEYFEGMETEQFVVVLLSEQGDVLDTVIFAGEERDRVNVDLQRFSVEVGRVRPFSAVIAHNHPSGSVRPSVADDVATKKILTILNAQAVNLLDHIIVSEDDYFSYHSADKISKLREELLR